MPALRFLHQPEILKFTGGNKTGHLSKEETMCTSTKKYMNERTSIYSPTIAC
jgi:hypothetical protein